MRSLISSRKLKLIALAFLVAVLLPFSFGYGEDKPAAAKISLEPASGSAKKPFTVTGSGFTPGAIVQIRFGEDIMFMAMPEVDSQGGFTAKVKVPVGSNIITHTIKATDGKGVSATAPFKVVKKKAK